MVELSQKQRKIDNLEKKRKQKQDNEASEIEEDSTLEASMHDVTVQESKCARFVTEYLTITAISMFISSYLGGFLLKFLTVRQMFAVSAVFPIGNILAGLIVQEQRIEDR